MPPIPQQGPAPSHGRSPSRVLGAILCWAAVVYLVLVLAVAAFVVGTSHLGTPAGDANFVGVYLIGVTFPLSVLIAMLNHTTLELTGTPMLFVLAGAGVIQAAALWGLGRLIARDSKPNST